MQLPNGVEIVNNTFALDFTLAEMSGLGAVKETYARAKKEWLDDIRYLTALAITCNHLGWRAWESDRELGKAYFDMWEELDRYILDSDYNEETDEETYKHFTKDEVIYFVRACD